MANIITRTFQTNTEVRAFEDDGVVWFVAADIARALGYRDAHSMTRMLDEDEKGTRIVSTPAWAQKKGTQIVCTPSNSQKKGTQIVCTPSGTRKKDVRFVDTPGGAQEMTVINESGLYHATLKSRRPEARAFRKWVTSEVLPAIRKTGRYEAQPEPVITPEQFRKLSAAVQRATTGWCLGDAAWQHVWNLIRVTFNLRRAEDLPARHFDAAMSLVRDVEMRNQAFLQMMCDLKQRYITEHMCGNAPWTPAITRKLGRDALRALPRPDWMQLRRKALGATHGINQ